MRRISVFKTVISIEEFIFTDDNVPSKKVCTDSVKYLAELVYQYLRDKRFDEATVTFAKPGFDIRCTRPYTKDYVLQSVRYSNLTQAEQEEFWQSFCHQSERALGIILSEL